MATGSDQKVEWERLCTQVHIVGQQFLCDLLLGDAVARSFSTYCSDGVGDVIPRGIGEAYVEHALVVGDIRALFNLVEIFQDIWRNHRLVAYDLDSHLILMNIRIIETGQVSEVISKQAKQCVHLLFGAIEVLDREGVDGDFSHTDSVAGFQDLWLVGDGLFAAISTYFRQRLGTSGMALF